MTRIATLLLALVAMLLPVATQADPADINAAARGVVRVVIMQTDGDRATPVSHGSGFAVTPTRIVTNAHVVREAVIDDSMRIGIIPSEGNDPSFAKLVAFSPNNDLALIEITGDLRLPPLTIAGGADADNGEVTAVGYPANVDRAQGLSIRDLFRSQPPVKSRGFISGARPTRDFDTILHTAPIARGNSGGPLLDACGRVLGVNSFGADSDGADAEFYFAVSDRELLPFLRDNNIKPAVNSMPCTSLAELDAAERARVEREQEEARTKLVAQQEAQAAVRDRARDKAELSVMEERENYMAVAAILLLLGAAAGFVAYQAKQKQDGERRALVAGVMAGICLVGAIAAWFLRPGMDEIDNRVAEAMGEAQPADADAEQAKADSAIEGKFACTIDTARSRITSDSPQDLTFEFTADGCVNGRTQYGYQNGEWSRLFVPNDEDTVSINSYNPQARTFRTDRYLLGRNNMSSARDERGKYTAPECGADAEAARTLGEKQSAVVALLPDQPNERLVYVCHPVK
ncbi:MAG: trypsin-like peptidase domain-containing protein [Sphingomonadales bacterium]|nr:trypsin-like peptidase domain-containing protein [Sphingomonadales bacterium]MBD3772574.1 trypsin-like peptidase domain-containing protein [Paracoccaceae bacterium]